MKVKKKEKEEQFEMSKNFLRWSRTIEKANTCLGTREKNTIVNVQKHIVDFLEVKF